MTRLHYSPVYLEKETHFRQQLISIRFDFSKSALGPRENISKIQKKPFIFATEKRHQRFKTFKNDKAPVDINLLFTSQKMICL